jgi:hypothetical protein
MAYIDPATVDSPRARWRLLRVLWDGGKDDASLALGMWDGEPVLAMRWNGGTSTASNPQSRGLPTWFILPWQFREQVLSFDEVPKKMRDAALTLFDLHEGEPT